MKKKEEIIEEFRKHYKDIGGFIRYFKDDFTMPARTSQIESFILELQSQTIDMVLSEVEKNLINETDGSAYGRWMPSDYWEELKNKLKI